MSDKPKPINAIAELNRASAQAQRFADVLEQYLAALTTTPRPSIEIGAFYTTFDGSLVCIVKRQTKCTCPMCSGRAVMMLGSIPLVPLTAPDEAPVEADHAEPADEPVRYVAIVLRGGHGVKAVSGEGPGDRYVVDAEGLMTPGDLQAGGMDIVCSGHVCVAALSLKQRLAISMMPEELPAAAEDRST